MTGMHPLADAMANVILAQVAAEVAWTEIVGALALALLALVALGAAVQGLLLLRSLRGTLRALDRTIVQLTPRTERVLHHAERVAEDASHVSAAARASIKRVNETVDSIDDRMREAIDTTEARVRRLGRVLDVVQGEVEETLLDAAATARGIQTTADRLQRGMMARREARGSARGRGDGHRPARSAAQETEQD